MIYKVYLLSWNEETFLNKKDIIKRILVGVDENEIVDLEDYNFVYEETVDEINKDIALEQIWKTLNELHPEDYTNRSLSVGDIIALDSEYYSCQTNGWKKINSEKIKI